MNSLLRLICGFLLLSLVHGACHGKWKSFRDSCYLFVDKQLNWFDAQSDCQRYGGWLVDIVDAEENAFVLSNLHDYGNWHFIGLNDFDEEGTFKWVTGYAMEYINFWPGEPNNWAGNEHCAEMRHSGQWNDVSCFKTQYYICEKESGEEETDDSTAEIDVDC